MNEKTIRIGTRGSRLALVQANLVRDLLRAEHGDLAIEIDVITTRGDRSQRDNIALSEIGGKGLFTLEIEEKLKSGEIDMAVHSTKDMPTQLPDGLDLVCYLQRENPADAFISQKTEKFEQLHRGAVIGSASLRRRALMWRKRPDLEMIMFRGNVDTRLQKVTDGVADATLLACAGLDRLGLADAAASELSLDDFPPAPGQGAIAVETRIDNSAVRSLLQPLNHEETHVAIIAERAFLEVLDGSCRTPIGAYAKIQGDKLHLHGIILTPDGSISHEHRLEGSSGDARTIGLEMGQMLRQQAGAAFFDGWE